jgi:phosphoribosylformimino-5-aminoimidazole carboxamide ribotide isomerase
VIAAPAVDLRGGRCVQLVGGRVDAERVSLPDPVAVAERWWELGFGTLHVVDLDAALGTGSNARLIAEIVRATRAVVHVGGGLRDEADVDAVLAQGAERVVVGTRAVDDPQWLERLVLARPGRVMVAADVRGGRVLRKGWTEASPLTIEDLLARTDGLPLAGVLCTDVSREGRMEGIDVATVGRAVAASVHPTWISGGVTSPVELEVLDAVGATGVVLGMALYTGRLPAAEVAAAYGVPANLHGEAPGR